MMVEDLRLSKNMKYTALYWALGYEEIEEDIFTKKYNKGEVVIDAKCQSVHFNNIITLVNGEFLKLTTHKNFVLLECIDKLLLMGYSSEIILDLDNEYDLYIGSIYIKCFEWGSMPEDDKIIIKNNNFISIWYESRLISGVVERKSLIKIDENQVYNYGFFENNQKKDKYQFYNKKNVDSTNPHFLILGTTLMQYIGIESIVVIPEGIETLESGCFWDNQSVEEIILPQSLKNLGGDTFYGCKNLKKIIIPFGVDQMGNNPFAGCPFIHITNESPYFNLIDGVLFTSDMRKLIYYPIYNTQSQYIIPNGTKIIGKHAFYLCRNLEKVVLPQSIIKIENNPFSGCDQLDIVSNSDYYHIVEKVIYNKNKTAVIGCLNSIKTECLTLLPIKRIERNSFWNCLGIKKIILPITLEDIGYNPFVGCKDIIFESQTDNFLVDNGILYNKTKSKIICYPSWKAQGKVYIEDSVIELERGAFSGCDKMTEINLHNVSRINKTCFTNCNSLKEVYCSDLLYYIGEWSFAHCKSLSLISVYKNCFVDKNVISNSHNACIIIREERSSYLFESENLYTLQSMLVSYKEQIDSIIIDPPYNSHIKYIEYQDSNFEGGYVNFISKRLELSYHLLSSNGCLILNIDKGGAATLEKLAKKIFGKKNVFVSRWKKLHPRFDQNRDVNPNKKRELYEYIIVCKKDANFELNSIMQPYFDHNILFEKSVKFPKVWDCFGTTSSAKDELEQLFGNRKIFSTPKPVKLIKEFIRAVSNKNSIVLDYFAGSGTTGQACLELNAEDGGKRKFILITNDESNICKNVTFKRLYKISDDFTFLQ